jgi:TonB family protein
MIYKLTFYVLLSFASLKSFCTDTLYFRLSNPWNTVKNPNGNYLRKCVKEDDYYHVWDYNDKNILVAEGFYSDTNFNKKLQCHKYFNEIKAYLEQTRCYENGRPNGYFVSYNEKGDTTDYSIYNNGDLTKSWSSKPQDPGPSTFILNEEYAEFPGGKSAWLEYLSKNLQYPSSLISQNIKGQVILKFVVNAKGSIEHVEVIKSLHPDLDREAKRVIEKSPKWKPAKQNGRNVQTTITQPLNFG